ACPARLRPRREPTAPPQNQPSRREDPASAPLIHCPRATISTGNIQPSLTWLNCSAQCLLPGRLVAISFPGGPVAQIQQPRNLIEISACSAARAHARAAP